jgi:hypothetical protein
MICSNCGARMERGSTECPECGALVRGPRYGLRRTFGAPPPPRPPRTRPSWRPSTLGQFVRHAPGGAPIASLGRNILSRMSEQLGRRQTQEEPEVDLGPDPLGRLPQRAPRTPGSGYGYDSFGPERDSFGPAGYGEPQRAPRTPYGPQRGGGTPRGNPQRSGPTPYGNPQRSGPTPYAAPQEARVPGYSMPEAVRYGPPGAGPMDDPWSSVAQPPPPPPQPQQRRWGPRSNPKDMFLDTGQGWSVAVPPAEPAPYTGYYSARQERPPTIGAIVLQLFGGSVRALFNFAVVIFAILFLAIPVLIGLQRIGALHVLDAARVSQSTPRPIPTAPGGFQTYVTPSFDLAFPTAWRYTQTTRTLGSWGTVRDGHVEDATNALIGVTVTTLAAVPADHHQVLMDANTVNVFQGRAANVLTTSPPNSTMNLDGATWLKEAFTFDLTTGQQAHAMRGMSLVVTQGLTTFIILMYAPAPSFDGEYAQQFSVTLASFRFVP